MSPWSPLIRAARQGARTESCKPQHCPASVSTGLGRWQPFLPWDRGYDGQRQALQCITVSGTTGHDPHHRAGTSQPWAPTVPDPSRSRGQKAS